MTHGIEATMNAILGGECPECGAFTHITLVEGTPSFLQEHGELITSTPYETNVWKGNGDYTDGAYTAVCEVCKMQYYAEHVTISGDWVA